jgi:3-(3-hydroxy-phenyl)propionate hydroxylase
MTYQDRYPLAFRLYPYARSADQGAKAPAHHPVTIVGGGPIGVATALDLALRGVPALVLDDHEGVGQGSRAICFAKRTLEIAHRLGCGPQMVEKGVIWNRGRVFHDRDEVFSFDLLPEDGHRYPAFINLQQPWFERFLVEAVDRAKAQGAPIEIRGRNRLTSMEAGENAITLHLDTPDGAYTITTDWLIACDGAKSPIRDMMGLGFEGSVFEDNFLIADVKMTADFPTERWFWFEPWFKSGASALLHKQPDDIWRIDFQLGWDIDRKAELEPGRVRKRVDQMLGPDVEYELDWTSIYTFQCRRMEKFRHGRVIFAGDAAHQVSPFGARGANSGIQDADNLGWKLAGVIRGDYPESVLDSYDAERIHAADENIRNSTRSTDFITPKTPQSRVFRDAVLHLAAHAPFARPMVNSGRLSVPAVYDGSPLNTADALKGGPARSRPGASCPDAQLSDGSYLLDHLGQGFAVLNLGAALPRLPREMPVLSFDPKDEPLLAERYLGQAERALYLIRPDSHVAARWAACDAEKLARALARAEGSEA